MTFPRIITRAVDHSRRRDECVHDYSDMRPDLGAEYLVCVNCGHEVLDTR